MEDVKIFDTVALRGMVLFPEMTLHFDVGRDASRVALQDSVGKEIFFVTQKDAMVEKPGEDDLYHVGVVGVVRQIIKLPEISSIVRVVVDGKYRARLKKLVSKKIVLRCEVEPIEDDYTLPDDIKSGVDFMQDASLFSIKKYFEGYAEFIQRMTPEMYSSIFDSKNLIYTMDYIASNFSFEAEDKQRVLAISNVFSRAEFMCSLLAKETELLKIDADLQDKVREQIDKNQREYYLKEELKAISEELGETDADETAQLERKIKYAEMPEESKEKLLKEVQRLKKMSINSTEGNVIRAYLDKCLELPWGKYTKENTNIKKAVSILEKDHYGLKDVKERITEMLCAMMISKEIKGQIICLAGPPGVGKTSVAKSIARATNRNYVRISLGGVRDEAEIRGHRKTYIGSMPGRIVNALIDGGSMNCLMLLDEIDKLNSDFKGDPSSALLEVLDAEQNFSFRDHYLEIPVDLSKILFITTANDKNAIPDALRDRMEIIDIPSYTYEEKFHIAKKHLIPKKLKEYSLTSKNIKINDKAIKEIIDGYTREAGVRKLERKIETLCRKEAVRLAYENNERLDITTANLEEYLGVRIYKPEEDVKTTLVGVVNGLAWTSVGGELLKAEALVLKGTGKVELTGSLGEVMKESVKTAISLVRSRGDMFNINPEFYKENDLHIHFPEGAVPKDGPSAGITVTTALVSALSGIAVKGNIAMTGEVTLTGRVLPIGGLKEKSMAAYREGIKTVIIPYGNIPDLQEIDDAVKEKLEFIPVKTIDEILSIALVCN